MSRSEDGERGHRVIRDEAGESTRRQLQQPRHFYLYIRKVRVGLGLSYRFTDDMLTGISNRAPAVDTYQ